jgi:two-component system phosphate regulon response regulator OmpR
MPTDNILLVDDDPEIRSLLTRYLAEHGFEVQAVANGEEMWRLLQKSRYTALILDLMLPGEDGLTWCRKLRAAQHYLPVLMLTARGQAVDRIIGLEMGADDYLPKPFDPRELLARLRALLRRRTYPQVAGVAGLQAAVRVGEWLLDAASRCLQRGDAQVQLTTREYAVLRALVDNPLVPLSRERLLELSAPGGSDASDRSIDVMVARIRKLLGEQPGGPRHVQTVWGFGYVFVPDGRAR